MQAESFDRGIGSNRIRIKLGDRWVIMGVTRSGKTTFAKRLLAELRKRYPNARYYIIDSKFRGGDFEDFPGVVRGEEVPDVLHAPGVLVWQTPYDDPDKYGQFIENILKAGKPAIIFIDEISSLGRGEARTYPPALAKVLKQGGGLHIGVIINSQESVSIPRQILGQATHLVRFPLEDEYDARRVDKKLLRPDNERGKNPPWYHFIYRRLEGLEAPMLFRDYREFFK